MGEGGMAVCGFSAFSLDSKGNALYFLNCLVSNLPFALLELPFIFGSFIQIAMHVNNLFGWVLGLSLNFCKLGPCTDLIYFFLDKFLYDSSFFCLAIVTDFIFLHQTYHRSL